MNTAVNEITRIIAGKSSLEECTGEELRKLAAQYPYFSPAQLLFVRKLKDEKKPLLKEHIEKASLYFENPLWFNHLLHRDTLASPIEIIHSIKDEPPVPIEKEEEETPVPIEKVEETPLPIEKEDEETHVPIEKKEEETPVLIEKEEESPVQIEREEEKPAPIEIKEEETPVPERAFVMETPATHEEVVDQTRENEHESNAEDLAEPAVNTNPELLVELSRYKLEETEIPESALSFEPYHTIDYFASQGINAKEEETPQDKLTKQLKSFTEWLKVMKKLPSAEIAKAINPAEEQRVEKMARRSIGDRDVVTEAMAEVWEKQSNPQKAVELYEKLSLLNPHKSSYFAAKIEKLKNP